MAPLIVLLGSFLIIFAIRRFGLGQEDSGPAGRMALAIMFVFTGVAHFFMIESMSRMLPDFVPFRPEIIVLSGVAEIVLGLGLVFERTYRLAGILMILFLVAILPSNVYAAIMRVEVGGHAAGPVYLLFRVPLQMLFIGWAYYFALRRG